MKKIIAIAIIILAIPTNCYGGIVSKQPSNRGLVAYWSFDEGNGTQLSDLSGNNNNGALQNSPLWDYGRKNKSLLFMTGSPTRVVIPDSNSLDFGTGDFSISFWMKATSTGFMNILDKEGLGSLNNGYGVFMNSGVNRISFRVDDGVAQTMLTGNIAVNTGKWVYVTCIRASNIMYIYINGKLDSSFDAGTVNVDGSNTIQLGSSAASPLVGLMGNLDEMRIYNRALSTTEILNLYNIGQNTMKTVNVASSTSQTSSSLVLHWKLDEGNGTSITDSSGNGYTGTLYGGGTWNNGKSGGSILFDGVSSRVAATSSSINITPQITIASWVKIGPTSNQMTISIKGNSNQIVPWAWFSYIGSSNNLQYWNGSNSAANSSTISIEDNKWHHVAMTGTVGSPISFYVDGVNVTAGGSPNFSNPNAPGNYPFEIGARSHTSGVLSALQGNMDDFRLYSKELSTSEIQTLYKTSGPIIAGKNQGSTVSSGLIGYYSFNGKDISDKIYDLSTSKNHGYITGIATSSALVAGKVGQAMTFDGVNDYILTASNLGISGDAEFTMCAWIYMDRTVVPPGYESFMGNNSTGTTDRGLSMTVLSARPAVDFWNNRYRATNALSLKTWHHVCGTKVAGTISPNSKIYVNGVVVSGAVEGTNSTPNILDAPAVVGRLSNTTQYWFTGKIDEARFYNRALSASEIKTLYLTGK